MYLPRQSLKKFVRESLLTTPALKLKPAGVEELKGRLKAWFAINDDLTMTWDPYQGRDQGKTKTLCSIQISGARSYYSDFSLALDEKKCLGVTMSYDVYPVGNVDELFEFLRLYRERAARMKGQAARRKKVRKLRGAAVLARIQDLARKHRFDFAPKENSVNVDLAVRFDGGYGFEVTIPVAKLDDLLPQFEAILPLFRDLLRAGALRPLRARLLPPSYSRKWIRHQTLGAEDPNLLQD